MLLIVGPSPLSQQAGLVLRARSYTHTFVLASVSLAQRGAGSERAVVCALVCQAVGCIRRALADAAVRTGHRLSLCQRALRIRDSPSCRQLQGLLHDLPLLTVHDVTHVSRELQLVLGSFTSHKEK